MSPTQELIVCILRRQSSPIYGMLERTEPERRKARQKKAHEKASRKLRKMSPQKTEINRITREKEEKKKKKQKKKKVYVNGPQIVKNGDTKDRKGKEEARAEKANK